MNILIKLLFILILLIPFNTVKGQWFCRETASERQGNIVNACGIGRGKTEAQARSAARNNAFEEFKALCQKSYDCRNRKITIRPLRNECIKNNNFYKCYRGIEVRITEKIIKKDNDHNLDEKIKRLEEKLEKERNKARKKKRIKTLKDKIKRKEYSINDSHYNFLREDFLVYFGIGAIYFHDKPINPALVTILFGMEYKIFTKLGIRVSVFAGRHMRKAKNGEATQSTYTGYDDNYSYLESYKESKDATKCRYHMMGVKLGFPIYVLKYLYISPEGIFHYTEIEQNRKEHYLVDHNRRTLLHVSEDNYRKSEKVFTPGMSIGFYYPILQGKMALSLSVSGYKSPVKDIAWEFLSGIIF